MSSPSTTTLASSVNPSVYGQVVSLTASVFSGGPPIVPTGTVEYFDGVTSLGTYPLVTGQHVLLTTALDVAGSPHALTAVYSGDGTFDPSTSNTVSQGVNAADTTTALSSSLNPSSYGQSVTFAAAVAVVSPGVGTPTGTVTFYDNVTLLATRSLVAGAATFITSALTVATHPITVQYNGDGNFNTSTSNLVSQVVNAASVAVGVATTTVLAPQTPHGNPLVFPGSAGVFISVSVTSTGTPTGTVQVRLGSDPTVLGSGMLSSGQATVPINIPALQALGETLIYADYLGDSSYNPNTGQQTVDVGTRTTLTFGYYPTPEGSGLPGTWHGVDGVPVTVTAQMRGGYFISGNPHSQAITGINGLLITFKEGGTVLGTAALDPVTAYASISLNLSVGTHILNAFFAESYANNLWAGDSLRYQGNGEVGYLSGALAVASSGGDGPTPHPPAPPPPTPGQPSSAVIFPCDQRISCPGTDSPVLNLSSEAIDYPGFYSMYFGYVDPPMGLVWSTTTCLGVSESTVSQEQADLLAAANATLCLTNPDVTYWNTAQLCSFTCLNGVESSYTTAPHSFQGTSQETADALAHSYACLQAALLANCFGQAGNSAQTCSYTCPNDGTVTTFTTPPNSFLSGSESTSNSLAHQYACLSAQAQAGCVFGFGNVVQHCSHTCPDGSVASATTAANTFHAATQAEADDLAHQFACFSAQLASGCSSSFGNSAQTCAYTCQNDASVTSFTIPANTFQDSSQSAADSVAHDFACLSAQLAAVCVFGFGNTSQACSYACPNGNVTSHTTAANSFYATTQSAADALANEYACLAARAASNCLQVFQNSAQVCTFTCQTGQSSTFTTPAGTFIASSQAAADQLANDYACLSAMLEAFQNPECGSQPANCPSPPCTNIPSFGNNSTGCTVTCPDGLPFTYTVAPNQFFAISLDLANRMASSYACRQAELHRICMSALSLEACCLGTTGVVISITAVGVSAAPFNLWEISSGALPPGMDWIPSYYGRTITITGTPITAGNFAFAVRVTQPNGSFFQKAYQFCVTELLPATLSDAPVNTPYSQTLTLNCGGAAAAWFLASGTLPPGITLNSEDGTLSGTPTVLGSYSFTIQAQLP